MQAIGLEGGYAGVLTMTGRAKPYVRKGAPPIPKYWYKLVTVSDSQQAFLMEKALRGRIVGLGMSYFTIGREGGSWDVMGDSGRTAMDDGELRDVRAVAAQIRV